MSYVMPFGKHRGRPLSEIPDGYLQWLLREVAKLSAGLRAAAVAELTRRGRPVPDAPPPPPRDPRCWRCGSQRLRPGWMQVAGGGQRIKLTCADCGRSGGFAPHTPEYVAQADAGASPTAVLDVLTECEEQGITLASNGETGGFASYADWQRASPELRAKVAQCRVSLGRMMRRQDGRRPANGTGSASGRVERPVMP
jgi:hypothetical protein